MRPTIACLLALSLPPAASGQCYTHRPREYVSPARTDQYPYHDNRFQVTYNVTLPPPAVTGSTIYGNIATYGTAPYGFSLLDPLEAYRLRINAGQRGMELGAQLVQSADVVIAQAAAAQESQLKLRLLEELDRFVNGASAAGGAALQLRASRDAQGRLQVETAPSANSTVASAPSAGSPLLDVQAITKAKCVACHGSGKKEKGLDLSDVLALDPKYEEVILKRILPDDPKDQMPPPGSGLRLSFDEKMAFVKTSHVCRGKPAEAAPAQPAKR
jgi:mono/diheme cytochrome c family protein